MDDQEDKDTRLPARNKKQAMLRGAQRCCPNCGARTLFVGYLKTHEACSACGEAFHHHRADDAPAYIVITLVGHIAVFGMWHTLLVYDWSAAVHLSIWLPLAIVMSFFLLPVAKGGLIGLQWASYMHGFDPKGDINDPDHPNTIHEPYSKD